MADKLSCLSTSWTLINQAHAGSKEEAAEAQRLLLQRYGGAVYRYLLAIVGDAHAAEELSQEFGLALITKRFRRANPQRGRFRNYLKTALRHLAHTYRRKQNRQAQSISEEVIETLVASSASKQFDGAFDDSWREQILARTWEALEQAQPTFYAVLRCRVEHPKSASTELAQLVTRQLGKPFTADNLRQTLRRARRKFGELLLHEVGCSLDSPTMEGIEEELRDLRLLDYCKETLERYKANGWK